MISKTLLAILIVMVISISVIGTYIVLNGASEEGTQTASATAKVNVLEKESPPSSTGYVSVNVIENQKGG